MDQAQGTQRFDQGQFGAVKLAELLIAVDQCAQLARALLPVTAEQHPQVLHGRAHAGVVQVDKVRTRAGIGGGIQWGPQDIAGVAVPMQPQQADTRGI